jgi:phage gpG-like protein
VGSLTTNAVADKEAVVGTNEVRYPVVHVQGGSAIRRPLIVLAVCAVGVIGYLARDSSFPRPRRSSWR